MSNVVERLPSGADTRLAPRTSAVKSVGRMQDVNGCVQKFDALTCESENASRKSSSVLQTSSKEVSLDESQGGKLEKPRTVRKLPSKTDYAEIPRLPSLPLEGFEGFEEATYTANSRSSSYRKGSQDDLACLASSQMFAGSSGRCESLESPGLLGSGPHLSERSAPTSLEPGFGDREDRASRPPRPQARHAMARPVTPTSVQLVANFRAVQNFTRITKDISMAPSPLPGASQTKGAREWRKGDAGTGFKRNARSLRPNTLLTPIPENAPSAPSRLQRGSHSAVAPFGGLLAPIPEEGPDESPFVLESPF